MKKILLTTIAIFVLGGCNSNPYPDGEFSPDKTPHHDVQNPPSIDAPSQVTFSEGVEGSFTIASRGQRGVQTVVAIDNLPKGAVFTPADNKVTWKPDFEAGNDPNNPQASYRTYLITVKLYDAGDPKSSYDQKEIALIVNDVPREFQVSGLNSSDQFYEGDTVNRSFSVADVESPNGPFRVSIQGGIPGIQVIQDPKDPKTFKISLAIPYDVVTYDYMKANSVNSLTFNWSLVVIDAKKRFITVPLSWQVEDQRQDGQYVGPSTLDVTTTDFDFIFMVKDPNFEVQPKVTVAPVANGVIKLDPLPMKKGNSREAPTSIFRAHWSKIRQTANGQTEDVNFEICVNGHYFDPALGNCTTQTVKAQFKFSTNPTTPPVRGAGL